MADHRTVLNRAECAVPLLRRGSVVIYDPPFNVDTVLMRRLAVESHFEFSECSSIFGARSH